MIKRDYTIIVEGVVAREFRVTATTATEATQEAQTKFKQQLGADNAITTKWKYNASNA